MSKKKRIILICVLVSVVIGTIFIVMTYIKYSWFKQQVKDGRYTIIGRVVDMDDRLIEVKIKIKDNKTNKCLIVYKTAISVYASTHPREDNYCIECTEDYINIKLISDDKQKYLKEKENYNNNDKKANVKGDRFYFEDLEKISNQ